MRYVSYVFLREGSSDDGLAAHFESMLIRLGADEVVGEIRPYGGSVQQKLEKFLAEGLAVDVIFIHRDADNAGFQAREEEIFTAAARVADCPPVIPVVPVTMTEAWLLADRGAIESLVGNGGGNGVSFPGARQIETIADAKSCLKEFLGTVSGLQGAKLARLNKHFNRNRGTLLNRLDPEGKVRQLPSWQRLEQDIEAFIAHVPRAAAG